MSYIQVQSTTASDTSTTPTVALKLEVAVLPVADVGRAKRFYGDLGWRLERVHFNRGHILLRQSSLHILVARRV